MIWLTASIAALTLSGPVRTPVPVPAGSLNAYILDDAQLVLPMPARVAAYPVTVPIPQHDRLTDTGVYRLEQEDSRLLPDGSRVAFGWSHRARFIDDADGLIVELTMIDHRCSGSTAICAGFAALAASQPRAVRRFRIGFDATVAAAETARTAATPLPADPSAATDRLSAIVTAIEGDAPGFVGAAEVRNIMLFAGRRLTAVGDQQSDGTERMTTVATTDAYADILVEGDSPATTGAEHAIRTETLYRVDLQSGLVISATVRNLDGAVAPADGPTTRMAQDGRATLLRERQTRLIPDPQ